VFWPAMMIGSCLRGEDQRGALKGAFARGRYRMLRERQGVELLSLLWGDSDEKAFGPRGLEYLMQKYKHDIISM